MEKLEINKDITTKHRQLLFELRRHDNLKWTIMNKRPSSTDGNPNHQRIFTEGYISVNKKPYLKFTRERFDMILVRYPKCLGGGSRYCPRGMETSTDKRVTKQ